MSKRKDYSGSFSVSRNVKKRLSETLESDLALWSKPSTSAQGTSDHYSSKSETLIEEGNTQPDELNNVIVDSGAHDSLASCSFEESEGLASLSQLSPDRTVHEICETNEISDAGRSNLCDDGIEELELGTACGLPITLIFDCEICINCKCGVCEECLHTDGITCQHCQYCVSGIDSGAESCSDTSSESDSDQLSDDVDSFDLNQSSDTMPESEVQNENIKTDFVNIVLDHNVSHGLVDNMLGFFRKYEFGNFPKSAKTLLKTPISTVVKSVPPGEYWHRGITDDLLQHVRKTGESRVRVSFSVDGVPHAKSTGGEFYPICCSFDDIKDVYLAGVYYGVGKPNNIDEFLLDFVNEMNNLVTNGLDCDGKNVEVELYLGVFDAVAKAMLLNIKHHTGFFSCTKCTVQGVYLNKRTAFTQLNCPLRTDASFALQSDEEYHHGTTLLTSLKTFKPVTNVALDYMHLVLLGVLRTMVYMLISGPLKVRQQASIVTQISNALVSLSTWVPCEFARKCRSLLYVKKFKATEWRMLLLYLGPVVLHYLPKPLYEHFLILHVSILILSSPVYIVDHLSYAKELLIYFVKNFMVLYGKCYVTHNLHNLVHLADDCLVHGVVDKFSAFRYENFYQSFKKMVRARGKALQQLARRYGEQKKKKESKSKPTGLYFGGMHTNGPLPPTCVNPQFSYLSGINQTVLKLSQANNCCRLNDNSFVVIENFTHSKFDKSKLIVGRKFMTVKSLYSIPCDSSIFGINIVSNLSALKCWPVASISCKCFRMPFKEGFAVFPLLHSEFQGN